MSHLDMNDGVLYPQGGFGQVIASIENIARDAGVEIRTGATVTRIVLELDPALKAPEPEKSVYDYETTEFDTNVIDRDELRRLGTTLVLPTWHDDQVDGHSDGRPVRREG